MPRDGTISEAAPTGRVAKDELMALIPVKRLVLLGALMVLGSLSEGIGLLMLVPLLSSVGTGGADMALPLSGWATPLAQLRPGLGLLLALFVALVSLRAIVSQARLVTALRLEVQIVDGLRARAVSALLGARWRTLSAMRQSDNRALLITTIDRVGLAVNQALEATATAINLGAILIAAMLLSPPVALAALVGGATVLALYRGLRRRASDVGNALSAAYDDVFAKLEETLGALRLIKSFGKRAQTQNAMEDGFHGLRAAQFAFLKDSGRARIALQAGGAAILAILVWLAIERWGQSPLVILPLVALFARALPQIAALQECWQHWAHAAPAIDQALDLIARAEDAAEEQLPSGAPPPRFARELRLEDVTLHHQAGRPALNRLDLTITAGSLVALSGPSGAGKSTLADILGGLVMPDSGRVLIDDILLDEASLRAWRGEIAYVQQDPILFSGSVRQNLLWAAPDASEARLHEVLKRASADFALALPGGLDCELGEGGRQMSGGERQRIVLARALLRNPQMLILDEPASAIDPANEAAIAAALGQLRGQLTILLIGHHGSLEQLADRHIRMEAGRIAETQCCPPPSGQVKLIFSADPAKSLQ